MNRVTHPERTDARETGLALLALLMVVGVGALAIVLAAQQFVPPLADRAERTESGVARMAGAVATGFVASGVYPGSLDAVAVQTGWSRQGAWRRDPWGSGQEWVLGSGALGLQVQSRGVDGVLGTADDVVFAVPREPLVRLRQRGILRLIRAGYVRFLQDAIVMGGAAPTGLAAAVGSYARARRQWFAADAAERAQLTATMAAAAASVTACQEFAGWTQPSAVTGSGGLLARLGMPDTLAIDGLGQPLRLDPILGVVAVGGDGIWGTDDDM